MSRLTDKVAIVTGSGKGMGRAMATLFAAQGAAVAVTDVSESDGLETVRLIEEQGGRAAFWRLDVSDEAEVSSVFEQVTATFGKLDILVNNAGISGVDKPTHEVTEAEWDAVFAVDVKGVFFCTKHSIGHLRANGGGSIVNISSIYGLVGSHEMAPYHAAKGAVTIMTKKDAVTYGRDGIRVNSVHPGTILTPFVRELAERSEGGLRGYLDIMEPKHPIGHVGEPEDVANAVLFLASDEARFVHGAALVVDGGYTAV
ncbi:short-chain dehydrogenase [Rhodococcus sp. 06-418-5]|uniref:SDR family NAD(P)-dependent oxidoreductase n=1 Tax=unclassified Rhodococcus (in: high G+C Gram-positive bacteria) TaxID=192944 RepID=UPI000B9AC4A3|nr:MULTISPECIES: SDR family NAD(P)-dependent oxidoreductase [unclassified Rhodococcus (in: high G+C Gram-positive bacteria)]OZC79023.1 short-chain dehydrogenase [Rhodococcus sp. 06-418-5]OZE05125.1 short-chain dehydrogenase [Rhodococcus sp. 05-2255-3C]OZE11765.1 short-chain dehydrogenase [Rhodococcus sp. 05-2255-3B1]OZE24172.1 short-chain dehydrogenase [Rhodococcus sp. 05-2255-2A2]